MKTEKGKALNRFSLFYFNKLNAMNVCVNLVKSINKLTFRQISKFIDFDFSMVLSINNNALRTDRF